MKYLKRLLSLPLFIGHKTWQTDAFSGGNRSPNLLRRSYITTPAERRSIKFPYPHALSSHPPVENDVVEGLKLKKWMTPVLDLNNDGKIDAKDVEVLISIIEEQLDLNIKEWKSNLDLNNDGKIDAEDFKVLITRLKKLYLDVNGDKKIDVEDVKAALCLLALTSILFAFPLPAHAKGGGGRSGGGSRSSSSSSSRGSSSSRSSGRSGSSSSSYHSSYMSDDRDYPRWTRPNYHGFPNLDPRMCFNLPENGEVINVLRNEYTGEYAPSIVTNVDDGFWCSFTALPLDGQPPERHHSFRNHWFYDALGVVILRGDLKALLKKSEKVVKEVSFDKEFNQLPIPTSQTPPPKSGQFTGKSRELDGAKIIVQDVKTDFMFMEDGSILGSGTDSADGDYMVAGSWREGKRGYLLRWKEVYDNFDVKVQGKMMNWYGEKVLVIQGDYRSSLDIRGSFAISMLVEEDSPSFIPVQIPIYEVPGVKLLEEVTFENNFRNLPEPDLLSPPPFSGRFVGKALEKDGDELISQNVTTDLVFEKGGNISGSGTDSIDGDYEVVGRWKKSRDGYKLSWKEMYDNFDVKVQGEMINTESTSDEDVQILGAFRSSLKIRGKFDIKLCDTEPSRASE